MNDEHDCSVVKRDERLAPPHASTCSPWANATAQPLQGRYSLLPKRGEVITVEHVRRLMDEAAI